MSETSLAGLHKADIAFCKAYQQIRFFKGLELFAHLVQAVALIIFIPIDATILPTGDKIIAAEGVALFAALYALITQGYFYYLRFKKNKLLVYCQMARDTRHTTQQPITDAKNEQDCTSSTIIFAVSGIQSRDINDEVMEVYKGLAIEDIVLYHHTLEGKLQCLYWLQVIFGFASIVIAIILLVKSSSVNPAQIAILACYIVIEAITKGLFIAVIILLALSPLICLGVVIYYCCCGRLPNYNEVKTLDKEAVEALPEDVINCNGQCAICLQNIKEGDQIYNHLPCSQKHIFHKSCLDSWVRVKLSCPTCRQGLPTKRQQRQGPVASQVRLNVDVRDYRG